jgi:stage IV sporulation protein FA
VNRLQNRADQLRQKLIREKKDRFLKRVTSIQGSHPSKSQKEVSTRFFERFLIKSFFTITILFVLFMVNRSNPTVLHSQNNKWSSLFGTEWNFAAFSQWTEKKFGSAINLIPSRLTAKEDSPQQAITVFADSEKEMVKEGEGVRFITKKGDTVVALMPGKVIFSGIKSDHLQTVVIQHSDGTEATYGLLKTRKVQVYDSIKAGEELGRVSENDSDGFFFLAYKKGGVFVDPSEVIQKYE